MTFQGSADLSEPARQPADFTYKIAPIVISIVDSGSGQRSVIEGIGKLSTGTKTQIGSFKESVQATTRLTGNRKLAEKKRIL
jgi:hypothetical protein